MKEQPKLLKKLNIFLKTIHVLILPIIYNSTIKINHLMIFPLIIQHQIMGIIKLNKIKYIFNIKTKKIKS